MSEPNVEITASSELIAAAKAKVSITDARNRTIVLRKPSPLAQFRLVRMVGGHAAENAVYMSMILPLSYIESIDGDPIGINNELQLDSLIQRLDEEAIVLVQKEVEKNFSVPNAEEGQAELKN